MTAVFDSAEDFAALLPRIGALAGLDLGTKTIGVAVSDGLRSVASPICVVRREKFTLDADALLRIVKDRALAGLVLG
jgi:putative Holliday junction resolvase